MNYLRAVRRSWYLVLIGLVFGAGAGWLAYHQATPSYRTSIQLSVGYGQGQLADELSSRALAAERAQAFIQIAATRPVVAAAISEAGRSGAAASVTAGGSSSDSLFTVTVTSSDKLAVAPIANAYQHVLIPQLTDIVGPLDSAVRLNVVQPATTPGSPFAPVMTHDVGLGLLGGLLLGLIAALLIEVLDRGLGSAEDVSAVVGLPIMGTIPRDSSKATLPALTQPRGPRAEAYRQVRTAWFALEPPAQVLAVTSSSQAEGKTTVATNVAAVAARAGHSVIVVDADLRRPRVAEVYGRSTDHPGLAEVLNGTATLDAAIQGAGEAMPDVLASGEPPADPSEILASEAFEKLIADLRGRYEYVVIDTPPVLPVTDAVVVAPRVDAVLIVARIGASTREKLARMMGSLERVSANVVGVVPNGVRGSRGGTYGSSYYYYGDTTKASKKRRASGKRAASPTR